jgi:hypothetical protein
MGIWNVLTYAAWSISAILLVWMVIDAFMVSSQYDEEYLMSSREGAEDDVARGVELDGGH